MHYPLVTVASVCLQHSLPGDSVSCKDSDTSSRWNTSDQALRYDNEQDIRSRSRLLKRASQVGAVNSAQVITVTS